MTTEVRSPPDGENVAEPALVRRDAAVPNEPTWLLRFAGDVRSQSGEDGIIAKILDILPARNQWCVEFGAWDGLHLSNSRNLIENARYSAVLIEGDATKFGELRRNYAGNSRVNPVHAFVGFTAANGLDTILAGLPVPSDFDLLSIDVDGTDYHVWKAVTEYRPKVVVVEFNATIPTEVSFVQAADPTVNHGNSLRAFVELGQEKGYELIAVLPYNAFFVDRKYFPLFRIMDNRPERLRTDLSGVTYLFSGFDGTVFLRGNQSLPWHGLPLEEAKLQRLPRLLRKYPDNYNRLERVAFRAFDLLSSPRRLFGRIRRRLFGRK